MHVSLFIDGCWRQQLLGIEYVEDSFKLIFSYKEEKQQTNTTERFWKDSHESADASLPLLPSRRIAVFLLFPSLTHTLLSAYLHICSTAARVLTGGLTSSCWAITSCQHSDMCQMPCPTVPFPVGLPSFRKNSLSAPEALPLITFFPLFPLKKNSSYLEVWFLRPVHKLCK